MTLLHRAVLLSLVTLPILAPTARCQTTNALPSPQTPTLPAPRADDPLSDEALAVKVSFEVKRRAVRDLLADLSAQSGVAFTVNTDSATANKKVTARAKEMPLAQVMDALSGLYDVTWARVPGGYALRESEANPLERDLLRLGDLDALEARAVLQDRETRSDWLEETLKNMDEAALNAPDGVAVSTSPGFGSRLRAFRGQMAAFKIVAAYAKATHASLLRDVLRVDGAGRPVPTRAGSVLSSAVVTMRSPNGQTLAPIAVLSSAPTATASPAPPSTP